MIRWATTESGCVERSNPQLAMKNKTEKCPVATCCALALSGILAACGAGTDGAGNAGSGGGPGGPGGTGNPLDVVLEFSVRNNYATERTETIRASVPFPRGGYSSLANIVVSGHQTAWLPLQHWPDGTIKIAQAQFTDVFAANELKQYTIARDEPALTGGFVHNPWVMQFASGFELGAEVKDTFDVPYRGFASGEGTVLQSTPLVQTRRWRSYHMPVPGQTGIGRDYLTSTFYVTEYRDMPFITVDWILGNDYLGADDVPAGNTDPNLRALGAVDVKEARFLCKGVSGVLAYRPGREQIEGEQAVSGGYRSFRVMQNTFIGDAQTRRYRFLLRFEPAGASSEEVDRWQNSANAINQTPAYALASHRTWQDTAAAGLLGGPIAGPPDSQSRATGELAGWSETNHFGTWGTHGDLLSTAITGTPRNHPLSPELAHAIQGEYGDLLHKLEQMAWAQAMRPYHLWNLQVGTEQNIMLWYGTPMLSLQGERLGRLAIRDADPYPGYRTLTVGQPLAHGWDPYDHEHWSCDLLFDYYTVSGDAWAHEELRQIGQSLKGLMRITYYYTSHIQAARAEGWTMQGFAQCYQATEDPALRQYVMRRVSDVVDAQRKKNHASRAMCFQPNHSATGYPLDHEFFMPWQHGAVLYGYLGAYNVWEEPILLQIAEDVVKTVEYSWVTNVQSQSFGLVAQGLRYYVPATYNGTEVPANYWDSLPGGIHFGDSPLGGAHTFLIGGLHYLAMMTNNPTVRAQALHYGGILLGTIGPTDRWNKWVYCLPQQYAQEPQ